MRYHPDKNEGNRLAADKFLDVHEAYRILSDHGRRTAYDQQWWYNSRQRDMPGYDADSPQAILYRSEKLRNYLSSLGNSSVDRDALFDYLQRLLTETNVQRLDEPGMNELSKQVVKNVLQTSRSLRYAQMLIIAGKLTRLSAEEPAVLGMIAQAMKEQRIDDYWRRYQGVFILLIAVFICVLIFLLS